MASSGLHVKQNMVGIAAETFAYRKLERFAGFREQEDNIFRLKVFQKYSDALHCQNKK